MKQTVTILTALMIALLLVSGFIVMGSMQQSELLIERENQLISQTQQMDEAMMQIEKLEKAAQSGAQQLKQLTEERDALSQQLSDAVLSSQEANDAVAQQVKERKAYEDQIEYLNEQLSLAQQQNAHLEAALANAEEEAALTAMAYEQQAQEDAQHLQKLQDELTEALKPSQTPAPTPTFAVARPVLPR